MILYIFLFLLCTSILSQGVGPSFSLYQNSLTKIQIPQSFYRNEEPFYVSQTTLNSLSDTDAIEDICVFDPLNIEINELATFRSYNSSISNPEFLNLGDYIYFVDKDKYMTIYWVGTTKGNEKDPIYKLYQNNSINLNVEIDDNSTLYMYGNLDKKRLYIVMNNLIQIYDLNDFLNPKLVGTQSFGFTNKSAIRTMVYDSNNCFFVLSGFFTLDMYCFDSYEILKKTDLVVQSLMNLKMAYVLAISDIWIEDQILYVLEKNGGIFIFDIHDVKNIKTLYFYPMINGEVIRKYMQSIFVVVKNVTDYGFDYFLQEFYVKIDLENNGSFVNMSKQTNLGNEIPDIHLVRNYVVLLQSNIIRLYRHSVIESFPTIVQSNIFDGILSIHRLTTTNYNLFIAVFPKKMSIYSIETSEISLSCDLKKNKINKGEYFSKFAVFSTTCDEKLDNILTFSQYVICRFDFNGQLKVFGPEGGSDDDKTPLIAGLTVGLSAAVFLIGLLACCLCRAKKQYQELEISMSKHRLAIIGAEVESEEGINKHERISNELNNAEIIESNQIEMKHNIEQK